MALIPLVLQDKTKSAAVNKSSKAARKSDSYRGPNIEEKTRIEAPSASPKPSMSLNHPFVTVHSKTMRARICAGCERSFKEEEPPYGIDLKHPEKDFIAGTNKAKVTPMATPRYYHVDLQCI